MRTPEERLEEDMELVKYHVKAVNSHVAAGAKIAARYRAKTLFGFDAWRARWADQTQRRAFDRIDDTLGALNSVDISKNPGTVDEWTEYYRRNRDQANHKRYLRWLAVAAREVKKEN